MPTLTPAYGTEVGLTVTNLHSLSAGSWWASAAIDNEGSDDAMDAILGGVLGLDNTSVPTDGETFEVYVAARWGDATNDFQASIGTGLPGEGTKTEGTNFMKENLTLAAVVTVPATASALIKWSAGSVAALFGGVMPSAWCVLIHNNCASGALETTGSEVSYVPIKFESA